MDSTIRKIFLFLIARAHRNSMAAFSAAAMALLFARRLAAPAKPPAGGRTFEGEFRRIDR